MTLRDEFLRVFQVPPAMHPYIDMVMEARDMEVVVKLGHQEMSLDRIALFMGMSEREAHAFLERAYSRHVVNRAIDDGQVFYRAGTFYERLDPLSMYENWGDVPAEARDAVIEWQIQEFTDKWLPVVETAEADPEAFIRMPGRDVLLLHEALAQVEAATERVVVPCDCRALIMACNRPREACIRLDESAHRTLERGHGRRLSKEECLALVVDLDRAGLIHTGEREWQKRGEILGFCNCCACDCYAIKAAVKLGRPRLWTRSYYVADRDNSRCEHCGLCARRCQFGAFYYDGSQIEVNGKWRKAVRFDPKKCWGCGLCANACRQGAISMAPLMETQPEAM